MKKLNNISTNLSPESCPLCSLVFDSAEQLILELKKDGYGECSFCPKCGRDLSNPEHKKLYPEHQLMKKTTKWTFRRSLRSKRTNG